MIKCSHSLPETPKEDVKPEFVRSWRQFRSPEIRDLAWLLFSPRLVNKYQHFSPLPLVNSEQAAMAWLDTLQASAANALPPRGEFKRLGYYFEALIHSAIPLLPAPYCANYQVLDSHLQVKYQSSTLGEIDFILQNTAAQKVHLEATVKFYLQIRSPSKETLNSQANWVGPNAHDRLDKKFDKLFSKQLPLSAGEAFITQYPAYRSIAHHQHLFCGILFHHWNDCAALPREVNPQCLRGHWVRRSEFASLLAMQRYQFKPMPKLEWLGGDSAHATGLAPVLPEKSACFSRHDITDGKMLGRLMVVPDQWPNFTG